MMSTALLEFHEPRLSELPVMQRCVKSCLGSDLTPANIYLLQHKYGTQLVFHMEHLIRFFGGNGRLQGYTFPVGGRPEDIPTCLKLIENHAQLTGNPLQFCLLTEEMLVYLKEYYGKRCQCEFDRGDADYLYRRLDLAELPGTKYHKKRNHLASFLRQYPNAVFQKLTCHNADDALGIAQQWIQSQENTAGVIHELRAIEHALSLLEELNLCGGIVYVEQKPIAMAVASVMNSHVTDIHYEKCLPGMRAAYSFINRELARTLSTDFINREEDLNIDGLRQAKLSYHPVQILLKYKATIC